MIGVDGLVAQLSTDFGEVLVDGFHAPAQAMRQQEHAPTFDAGFPLELVELADLLELGVFWPACQV